MNHFIEPRITRKTRIAELLISFFVDAQLPQDPVPIVSDVLQFHFDRDRCSSADEIGRMTNGESQLICELLVSLSQDQLASDRSGDTFDLLLARRNTSEMSAKLRARPVVPQASTVFFEESNRKADRVKITIFNVGD